MQSIFTEISNHVTAWTNISDSYKAYYTKFKTITSIPTHGTRRQNVFSQKHPKHLFNCCKCIHKHHFNFCGETGFDAKRFRRNIQNIHTTARTCLTDTNICHPCINAVFTLTASFDVFIKSLSSC